MDRTITPMTTVARTTTAEAEVPLTPLPAVSLAPTLPPSKVVVDDLLFSILCGINDGSGSISYTVLPWLYQLYVDLVGKT
mmetsp:Transcript_28770/g.48957  ORF Transcript_28770/g.48957 Transcript_28770/m.48957 type:complete len:80 (-) Transcript_28770:35-274(-)